MNFPEFKANIVQWATDRGIYEHSTITAQLLKALSELGELADAIIKGDRDALKDAIGDVAVCLTIAGLMDGERTGAGYGYAMLLLEKVASMHDLKFAACCEAAWLEIKDRKGRMVPGGAFVKEE